MKMTCYCFPVDQKKKKQRLMVKIARLRANKHKKITNRSKETKKKFTNEDHLCCVPVDQMLNRGGRKNFKKIEDLSPFGE